LLSQFLFECHADQRSLHSFPTRRSSDLEVETGAGRFHQTAQFVGEFIAAPVQQQRSATHAFVVFARRHQTDTGRTAAADLVLQADRKSTRLNSSHVKISYAVFCLKKKKI